MSNAGVRSPLLKNHLVPCPTGPGFCPPTVNAAITLTNNSHKGRDKDCAVAAEAAAMAEEENERRERRD